MVNVWWLIAAIFVGPSIGALAVAFVAGAARLNRDPSPPRTLLHALTCAECGHFFDPGDPRCRVPRGNAALLGPRCPACATHGNDGVVQFPARRRHG